jgi:hypothetical protein
MVSSHIIFLTFHQTGFVKATLNGVSEIFRLKRNKHVTAIRWTLMFFLLRSLESNPARVKAAVFFGYFEYEFWRWELRTNRKIERIKAEMKKLEDESE